VTVAHTPDPFAPNRSRTHPPIGDPAVKRLARTSCLLFLSTLLGCLPGQAQPPAADKPAGEDVATAPGRFGFSGVEVYKVDEGASHLRCVDINGDGLVDIAIVNNARATIDFFIQKTPAETAASKARPVEYDNVNEIASDARFRKESVITEKRVFDMLLQDLNGDGRPDLVYYGDPKELVVVLRTATGWSDTPQKFTNVDARPSARCLAAGDLNGDGRTDLALLGLDKIYLFCQRPDGRLAEPVELPLSEKEFTALEIADIDGDGRKDLLLVGAGQIEPLRVRFQGPSGLGPEIALETAAMRSLIVGDATGSGRPEITVVQEATGRLVTFRVESGKTGEAVPLGRIRLFPLRGGEDAGRQTLSLADIDGDGKTDVLVTYPALAQFHLHRQGPTGDLLPADAYPALAGATGTCVGDLDGDGKVEIVVLSPEERALGVTRWDGARLAFPKALPLKGKPACAALADLDGQKGNELIVALEDEKGKTLQVFGAGQPLTPLGEPLKIEGAKDLPDRIVVVDVNQDGRPDLLLFFPYEPPRILLNDGPDPAVPGSRIPRFTDVSDQKDFGRGLLQGVIASSLAVGDVDGDGQPEFLLAKKGFARAFRVTAAKTLEVVDQFNARDPGAEIAGTACADFIGDGRPQVVLLDRARGRLWALGRKGKEPYQVLREIRIPSIRARSLSVADLNGDGRPDLVVAGEDRFGVLYAGGSDFRLKVAAQYETELKDVRLDLVERGDLDGDGRPDLVVTELRKHLLEILTAAPGADRYARGTRFKMFEEKGREGRSMGGGERGIGREPRDIAVADVTGDKKDDLILLVHDRILIYPQE
jgi:hypothetical protein